MKTTLGGVFGACMVKNGIRGEFPSCLVVKHSALSLLWFGSVVLVSSLAQEFCMNFCMAQPKSLKKKKNEWLQKQGLQFRCPCSILGEQDKSRCYLNLTFPCLIYDGSDTSSLLSQSDSDHSPCNLHALPSASHHSPHSEAQPLQEVP